MPQRLFVLNKIPVFLDGYSPSIEKRPQNETVKVIAMTLRVAPFDAKLATCVDEGIGGDSNLRATLFKLNHPEAKPHIGRVDFDLGCPRQNLTIHPTPDSASRIIFLQAKIAGAYARTQKDRTNGYDFVFRAVFGGVSRAELEYIHEWYRTQRFITFEEAEPLMEFEPSEEEEGETVDA